MTACQYCEDGVFDDHGSACIPCDRRMRDATRALSGFKPFTDEEYMHLRRRIYATRAKPVLLILCLLLLQACTFEVRGLLDLPDAPMRPVLADAEASATTPPEWEAQMTQAVRAWNEGLESAGCAPSLRVAELGETAYPVVLWTRDAWPHGADLIGLSHSGELQEGYVHVRDRGDRDKNVATLVHELGHALGLPDREGDTVMTAVVSMRVAPTSDDARDACESLR